jgi:hypothetical protein
MPPALRSRSAKHAKRFAQSFQGSDVGGYIPLMCSCGSGLLTMNPLGIGAALPAL